MKINDIREEYFRLEALVEEILTEEDPVGLVAARLNLNYEDAAEEVVARLVAGTSPAMDGDHDLSTIEDCVFAVFASHYGREVEQGDDVWLNVARKITAIT